MQLSQYTPKMAAERFQNDVLEMFYGPLEDDEILPSHSNLQESIFFRREKNLVIGSTYGKWMHQGEKMEIF